MAVIKKIAKKPVSNSTVCGACSQPGRLVRHPSGVCPHFTKSKKCGLCGAFGQMTPSGWICFKGHNGPEAEAHFKTKLIVSAGAIVGDDRPLLLSTFSHMLTVAVAEGKAMTDELSEAEASLLTASKIQLPQDFLSTTQIEMFLRCPQQFYRRYILGEKSPPGLALVEGRSSHYALQINNDHKIKTDKDLPVKQVVEAFGDDWSKAKKEVEDWEGDKPETVFARGKRSLTNYMTVFAPALRPEKAESMFCVPVGPVLTLGVKDVTGKVSTVRHLTAEGLKKLPPTIVDYKTVAKARSERDVENSLQLSGYAHDHFKATGNVGVNVGLCSLVKTNGNTVWVSKPATVARVMWFRRVVLSVANAISLGNFPLTSPDGWWCSERFCGYWKSCRGSVPTKLTINRKGR